MLQPCLAAALAELPGIRHGFFTRDGGVSSGIYAGLNCGLGSNDKREHVIENRHRVASHLGQPGAPVVTLYQTHSAVAVAIDGPPPPDALPKADAVVTTVPGLVIGALAADCCPILFADPVARVVAAAHAGWRGAVSGICEAAVVKMEESGAVRGRIIAAVGPCIGPDAYEVGPDFETDVTGRDAGAAAFLRRRHGKPRAFFDLPGYVEGRLGRLRLAKIENVTQSTYENESKFFSYRRACHRGEGDYGRQISAIVVA
ncbi:MAG: peptidoglycan editing factor PgeF [Hyphomicrobiaceae bacterium]|nr:peptidoglycan editing factor PgeF [Hyphomicrobiaceae bacterium]